MEGLTSNDMTPHIVSSGRQMHSEKLHSSLFFFVFFACFLAKSGFAVLVEIQNIFTRLRTALPWGAVSPAICASLLSVYCCVNVCSANIEMLTVESPLLPVKAALPFT